MNLGQDRGSQRSNDTKNIFFSTREIRGEDTQVRMTCRKPRGDLAILFFFVRLCKLFVFADSRDPWDENHHSSPPCVEYVCLQPTKKQIQAIETRKVVATGCLCLNRFQHVTLDISNGNIAQGCVLQFGENLGLGNVLFLFFFCMEFLRPSYSCIPGPTQLKQLLSCEPPDGGSNMCSGGMFEDGLGV